MFYQVSAIFINCDLINPTGIPKKLFVLLLVLWFHCFNDNMFFGTLSSGFTHYYSLLQTAIQ